MKKFVLLLFVLLFLAPLASSANQADAQVVVRVGPRRHHPYYRHRYYHRPYHRRYYHRY